MNKKLDNEFLRNLAKLEVQEFLGVMKILKIKPLKEDGETFKDFSEIFEEVLQAYSNANRTRRRELLEIIKAAVRKK